MVSLAKLDRRRLGRSIFLGVVSFFVGALVYALFRTNPEVRSRFWVLPVLPFLWIFVGLWGGYFWLDWQKRPLVPNPDWAIYPVWGLLWAFLALGAATIVYLKGGRAFAIIYFSINLYFLLAMSLLSGMAISGTWL
ncbi:MAG: hypothetical protein WD871_06800 [Xanthobacteraceae bacterium]